MISTRIYHDLLIYHNTKFGLAAFSCYRLWGFALANGVSHLTCPSLREKTCCYTARVPELSQRALWPQDPPEAKRVENTVWMASVSDTLWEGMWSARVNLFLTFDASPSCPGFRNKLPKGAGKKLEGATLTWWQKGTIHRLSYLVQGSKKGGPGIMFKVNGEDVLPIFMWYILPLRWWQTHVNNENGWLATALHVGSFYFLDAALVFRA